MNENLSVIGGQASEIYENYQAVYLASHVLVNKAEPKLLDIAEIARQSYLSKMATEQEEADDKVHGMEIRRPSFHSAKGEAQVSTAMIGWLHKLAIEYNELQDTATNAVKPTIEMAQAHCQQFSGAYFELALLDAQNNGINIIL